MPRKSSKWRNYEEVARFLLNEFRHHFKLDQVEEKQRAPGHATSWEIDAKAIVDDGVGFLIVECRRHTKNRISQEQLGGLAYRIHDTGARGGILVSPLGFQAGAKRIAAKEGVVEVRLVPGSKKTNYMLQFLHRAFVRQADSLALSDSKKIEIFRADGSIERRQQ